MSIDATGLEAVLKRDRAVVVAGLIAVSALSWFYIVAGAGMGGMKGAELWPCPPFGRQAMPY